MVYHNDDHGLSRRCPWFITPMPMVYHADGRGFSPPQEIAYISGATSQTASPIRRKAFNRVCSEYSILPIRSPILPFIRFSAFYSKQRFAC